MFRSSIRIPLRRFLHTTPPRPPPSQGNNYALVFGIGAMVAAVTYMSNPGSQRITLDANPIAALKHASVPSTASAETRTDILSSTKSTSLHSPEPATNETAPLNIDPEGGEPPEGADDDSSGGAFDPVTGEINWDCPCLGGMAHGPCGPQFREAFSCFVFSEKEPKGIDCVEKFKGMQDCFREHPDVYAEEIMDDDEDESNAPDSPDSPSEVQEGTAPSTKTTHNGSPQTQSS